MQSAFLMTDRILLDLGWRLFNEGHGVYFPVYDEYLTQFAVISFGTYLIALFWQVLDLPVSHYPTGLEST